MIFQCGRLFASPSSLFSPIEAAPVHYHITWLRLFSPTTSSQFIRQCVQLDILILNCLQSFVSLFHQIFIVVAHRRKIAQRHSFASQPATSPIELVVNRSTWCQFIGSVQGFWCPDRFVMDGLGLVLCSPPVPPVVRPRKIIFWPVHGGGGWQCTWPPSTAECCNNIATIN